jgi:amidohydrolase family protein
MTPPETGRWNSSELPPTASWADHTEGVRVQCQAHRWERTAPLFVPWETSEQLPPYGRRALVDLGVSPDDMASDDAGALPNIHRELALLVRAGLTPMEAIVAATQTNAVATGFEHDHGSIALGKAADLLVLRGDPTVDISNTTRIAFVVRHGQIVGDRAP